MESNNNNLPLSQTTEPMNNDHPKPAVHGKKKRSGRNKDSSIQKVHKTSSGSVNKAKSCDNNNSDLAMCDMLEEQTLPRLFEALHHMKRTLEEVKTRKDYIQRKAMIIKKFVACARRQAEKKAKKL